MICKLPKKNSRRAGQKLLILYRKHNVIFNFLSVILRLTIVVLVNPSICDLLSLMRIKLIKKLFFLNLFEILVVMQRARMTI